MEKENSEILKDDLLKVRDRLLDMEKEMQDQMKELEKREEKWAVLDKKCEHILTSSQTQMNRIVKINVSGTKFMTKLDTLLSLKDTLFYKLILSDKFEFNLNEEIFFDRSPRMFSAILDYLRYKKISYQRFSPEDLINLKIEADYYEIGPICDYLSSKKNKLEMIGFEFSGAYLVGGVVIGTNNIADLNDSNGLQTKGICANTPGWIIIELNGEWEIEGIEIGGVNGNTNWNVNNGNTSEISTSTDKSQWNIVGILPSTFYGISTVKLIKSSARYIKFKSTGYLGIGFLKILCANNTNKI